MYNAFFKNLLLNKLLDPKFVVYIYIYIISIPTYTYGQYKILMFCVCANSDNRRNVHFKRYWKVTKFYFNKIQYDWCLFRTPLDAIAK